MWPVSNYSPIITLDVISYIISDLLMESLVPFGIESHHVVFEPLGNGGFFTRPGKMLKVVMRVEVLLFAAGLHHF